MAEKLLSEEMRDKMLLLTKNEQALGEAIHAPKYQKAYTGLKVEAWSCIEKLLKWSVSIMYYRPELDDGKLGETRKEIVMESFKSLKKAFVDRNIDMIEIICEAAKEKAFDAWSEYFPLLSKEGGI